MPDETQAYESRIAALEERLAQFEGRLAPPPARTSGTEWAERFGLIVAWGLMILVIGYFKPDQMFNWNSYASMFGSQAMIVVLALGLIIPLTTGDFDLSVASTMGLAAMTLAVLNVQLGWGIGETIAVVLLIGAAVGAINAVFVLWFGIHSLIVTLGTGYFINGLVLWISNSATVSGVSPALVKLVILTRFLGIPLAFWFAAVLAIVIWYCFQHTAMGRRLLFVGRGREVARLSGVNVNRMRAGALIGSGLISALAGVLYAGIFGAADPSSSLSFLLPAFAAAFLGSTTLYPGRFNAPGAFVAVFFLSTGIMGLNFLGAQGFVKNLFYGGGLVVAVSISQLIRKRRPMD
jgi:ribose transport system permease protein